jgi:putative CRISPR-associated protein (TIGR02619 family)
MPIRSTLICTVGTSLFAGKLQKMDPASAEAPSNSDEIKSAFDQRDWSKLATIFQSIDPTERICGAEINTIEEAVQKRKIPNLRRLAFLVSDTADGRNTGKFLTAYYKKRSDLNLQEVESYSIEKLQDENPAEFKITGLRNLVRKMGECIQRAGGPEYCVIDATGGYKAQIAIAVIVGQALSIPVLYKHEKFGEVIEFPPLPVSFDYEVLASNAHVLSAFEKGGCLNDSQLIELEAVDKDGKLRVLLNKTELDGETYYELGPIGQIFVTGFRIRNPRPPELVPAADRSRPTFGKGHHYPAGFKRHVETVFNEFNWIRSIHSLPYGKQKSMKQRTYFSVKTGEDGETLEGVYCDNSFRARFNIITTDMSLLALTWAADQLNQKFGEIDE